MTKSAIDSWRFSPELKNALEREARREGVTLAGLLDRMVEEWVRTRRQTLAATAVAPPRLRVVPLAGRNVRAIKHVEGQSRSGRLTRDGQSR
jgi:murein L,D-transpeptidase YcbB/YkuD